MTHSAITVHPNRVYGERDGKNLTFDHYQPANASGAAIIFVNSGGFESGKLVQYEQVSPSSYRFLGPDELAVGDSSPIPMLAQFSFARLLAAGYAVFDVKHSNAPYTVDTMLDDIRAAVVHICGEAAEHAIDPHRVGIFGASSGGYLAIAAGLTARRKNTSEHLLRAIATYYPAGFDFLTDIEAFPQIKDGLPALAVDDDVLRAISIENLYSSGGPSTLVVYGDQDLPFIVNPCRSICSEFPKAGIETECLVVEGAAHEFMREDGYHPEDGQQAQAEMLQWFRQQLTM